MTIEGEEFRKLLSAYRSEGPIWVDRAYDALVAHIDSKMRERDLKLVIAGFNHGVDIITGKEDVAPWQSIIDEVDKS